MPLFGNKNATNTTGANTGTGPNIQHTENPAYEGTGNTTGHHGHTGPGPVIGGAAGGAAGHHEGHTAAGTALGAAAGEHHANRNPDVANAGGGTASNGTGNVTGHHGHTGPGPVLGGAAGGAAGHHEGHTVAGTALGAAAGKHHANRHPDVDNAGAIGQGYPAGGAGAGTGAGAGVGPTGGTGSAGEKAFVGKLEHAAGTALCSSTLKAKGLDKEREAQALKVQAAELGQAEGLESQAAARRERAVAHGAHPHHLGGGAGTGGTGVIGGAAGGAPVR